jgi:hypothetical protein
LRHFVTRRILRSIDVLRSLAVFLMLAAIVPTSQAAEAGRFHISPRVGKGEIRIDDTFTVTREREKTDALNVGCVLGYSSPIGLLLEVGAENQRNFDWFDAEEEFELSQQYVAIGYEFGFAEGWTFTPKAGRARWKLHSEEGQLSNPGPEEEEDVRGYDYFWEVQLSRQLTDKVSLGGAYQEGEFDFGRARSLSFLATFRF